MFKKNKAVNVFSSEHTKGEIEEGDEKLRPKIILQYNDTKAGVDIMNRTTREYTVQKATCRWTMALFASYLDMMIHNAWIVYCKKKKFEEPRKKFI